MMSTLKKTIPARSKIMNIALRLVSIMIVMLLSLGGQVANAQDVADLSLTKQVNRHFVGVGQNVVYIIILKNLGLATATNIQFGDSLPDQLNLVAFQCSRGVPSSGSFCQVKRLRPGEKAVAVLIATPITNITWSERQVSNTAYIGASSSFDPNDVNNTDSVVIIATRK